MAETSPLRRRMIEDMTVRNLSPATQRSYVHAVSKFRSPETLTLEDVRTFQVHLASKGVARASLNQTVAALRFSYGVALGMAEVPERIAYAREPRRLPVVLSADEVVRFLEAVPSLKSRAALMTAYAAGSPSRGTPKKSRSQPATRGTSGSAAAGRQSSRCRTESIVIWPSMTTLCAPGTAGGSPPPVVT